jgi:Ca2+-binding RTX toxin-like protein
MALALPGVASADVLYAAPGGSGGVCSESAPCEIHNAVETVAVNGDEVILKPGTYMVGGDAVDMTKDVLVHGESGSPRPRVEAAGDSAFQLLHADAELEDVSLFSDLQAVSVFLGRLDRIVATATASGGVACFLVPQTISPTSVLMRNSACIATGTFADAVNSNVNAGGNDYFGPTIRNSTLIATATESVAIDLNCLATPGGGCEMDVRNSIVAGEATDVLATASGDAVVTVTLQGSNYDTEGENGNASVTDPGTGSNHTAQPLLGDTDSGDVSQQLGSPTINAGVSPADAGTLDLDREPRSAGEIDIGADELVLRCAGATATHPGTNGADTINGTNGDDVVAALAGNDLVDTGPGNDLVCAGSGNDRVFTRAGFDRVFGEAGADRIFGGAARDFLFGQQGFDRLFGGAGGDRAFGGGQLDRLFGGPGFDRLFGQAGHDRAFGNAGRDLLNGAAGRDRLFGGAARDRILGLGGRPDRCFGGAGRDRGGRGCERRVSLP